MKNQEVLSAETHQSDKVTDPCTSQPAQWQHFALNTSTASSAKMHSADSSVEELSGGSIKKNKVEEEIYFLNEENKPPKLSESASCKDLSSKEDGCKVVKIAVKPASFELATKWNKDDSDLSNFIMLRSTHKLVPREEKSYVDCSEKGMQTGLFCHFSRLNSDLIHQLQYMLVYIQ